MPCYKSSQAHLKKPSKQAQYLQNKLIEKHIDNFTEKLGKNDGLKVKPISLHIDNEKPTAHIKRTTFPSIYVKVLSLNY